jgi:competence CoiA-like predicted nuclease
MVLSAITAAGQIVTPYKMLAQGLSTHDAYDQIRKAQDRGVAYFCPHCLKFHKKQIPVKFRGTSPENARPHFFHPGDGTDKCSASSPESEAHFTTKDYLAEWLRQKGATDVFAEYHLDNLDGHVRRPDILAIYGNTERVEAHEVQISPITSSEVSQRTEDILAQCEAKWPGVPCSVTWYMAKRNAQKQEIKDYFLSVDNDIKGYRLQWDENKIPVWNWLLAPSDIADYQRQKAAALRFLQLKEEQGRYQAAAEAEYQKLVENDYQRMLSGDYLPGDVVKGAPGRVSENWQGKIVRPQGQGWIVNWDGRRNHENPVVRKRPELFMLTEQIVPLPLKSHGSTMIDVAIPLAL